MKVRLGIDVACRAAHQASCADEAGNERAGFVHWMGDTHAETSARLQDPSSFPYRAGHVGEPSAPSCPLPDPSRPPRPPR